MLYEISIIWKNIVFTMQVTSIIYNELLVTY